LQNTSLNDKTIGWGAPERARGAKTGFLKRPGFFETEWNLMEGTSFIRKPSSNLSAWLI